MAGKIREGDENCGRRTGTERRQRDLPIAHAERRGGPDRRSGRDRRTEPR